MFSYAKNSTPKERQAQFYAQVPFQPIGIELTFEFPMMKCVKTPKKLTLKEKLALVERQIREDSTALCFDISDNTIHVPKGHSWIDRYDGEVVHNGKVVQMFFEAFHENKLAGEISKVHQDDKALEIPTTVLFSLRDAKKRVKRISKKAYSMGCFKNHPGQVNGGGHIHIGPVSEKTKNNLHLLTQGRHELLWAFNDPGDNNIRMPNTWERSELPEYKTFGIIHGSATKSYSAPVIEFRVFDGVKSWKEQELHIRFAQACVFFAENMPSSFITPTPVCRYTHDLAETSLLRLVRAFRHFIQQIGLDWRDYRRFARNIYKRKLFTLPG